MTYVILGLMLGATYSLIAIGIVFIYTVIDAFQFAYGALVMLSAYIFLASYNHFDNLFVAFIVLIACVSVLSLVMSRIAFEPLLGRHFQSLITGLGFSMIIEEGVSLYFYEGQAVSYPENLKLDGTVNVLGASVNTNSLLVLGIALATVIVLDRFSARSRLGMQMRAVAGNPEGAALVGVNQTRTIRKAFLLAGAIAAVGGVLLGLQLSTITPLLGYDLLIKGIAAALLGSVTSLRGAVLGAFIIGISESLAVGYVSATFSSIIGFGVILVILLARPQGLFGQKGLNRA